MAQTRVRKGLKERMDSGEVVQIKDVAGNGSDSVTVETDAPFTTNQKKHDLACVVPPGYVRYRFDSTTEHNGGGDNANVYWLHDDPADGTVRLEANCSGVNGYAKAAVSAVYAKKI